MIHKLSLISIIFVLFLQHSSTVAQSNRRGKTSKVTVLKNTSEDLFEDYEGKAIIDDAPEYTAKNTYILEKVVYTKTEVIFSLVFYFEPNSYTEAIFYPLNHQHHWFLKDLSTNKKYSFKSVRFIRKDGKLQSKQLTDFPLRIAANEKGQTIFTCRVHFDRLPNTTRKVNLIEGRAKSKNKEHFNFYTIEIKQPYLD